MPIPARHPKDISIEEFIYDLPDERIARFPLEKRDDSKLLIYNNGEIVENQYINLSNFIPEGSLVLFNEAKVIHARLYFQKISGAKLELFCLEPDNRYPDITTAMLQEGEVYWKCLIKGVNKWKDDSPLVLETHFFDSENKEIKLEAEAYKVAREGNSFILKFVWKTSDSSRISFSEFLAHVGKIPIPPYLKREADQSDEDRYQTIFAKQEGSVAAPTASLHFTPKILADLKAHHIDMEHLTLHVGAGTFMPVKSDTMEGHEMHSEWIEIPLSLLERVRVQLEENQKIIAIGTTSSRTIESVYWIGVQVLRGEWSDEKEHAIAIEQWYPYQEGKDFPALESVDALISYFKEKNLDCLVTRTQLIIAPGYDFKVLDGIITNFHQPASTLLLMISAFIGEDWKKVYQYALDNNFRFLSYGDGSLLWRNS